MKKIISVTIVITLLILCLTACKGQSEEMKSAIAKFDDAVASLDEANIELDNAISEANILISEGGTPLDMSLITNLETAISTASATKVKKPEMPDTVEEILQKADEISSVDYSDVLIILESKCKDLEISISKFALVNHPDEVYIIDCLKKVPSVVDISAVTEETDPMNNINKAGWYTAHVYFSCANIDQSEVYGDDLIDKGTDAGGSIEVYKTVEEAEKRNEYLATFDGGVLSPGSHTVVGTCVVRTSDELTATEQKNLETDIISTLICLPNETVTYLSKKDENQKEPTVSAENNVNTDEDVNYDNNISQQTYPSAVGTYTCYDYDEDSNNTLVIYSDGSLYMKSIASDPEMDGDYSPLEGTWTQDGDTLCYSVWDEYGAWNNPFYDTVYYDGIDFLGLYYTRVN